MKEMEKEVKAFIGSIKVFCKPLSSTEYKNLERKLRSAAEQFDENEESSKSEIFKALTSYEDYLRKNNEDQFQKASATVPYKTSRKNITVASSPSPENAMKEREGSSSSKHSNSEQGTKKDQRASSATKRNATNRVTKVDQKDRKTPTP
ncbi:uncharacterized protein LOC134248778 [Saccostrea cucullata]|uniref:uncharacterized protein LOC134248778 n=1 Tax=Saccostrea cuccullata TaxID=36930 RepID=UPI002ED197FA